ncbi:hypothetical protein MCEMAEM6B_00338 [Mycobacteriaceae bacterium]
MTRTGGSRRWRRGVRNGIAGVALAVGLVCGSAVPAHADILDDLAEQYAIGAGGGQLSKLLTVSLKLRAMGYKPSQAYLDQVTEAAGYRPNQNPLVEALKNTIAYQAKVKAQTEILQGAQSQQGANSAIMGAGQMPGASSPGMTAPGMTTGGMTTGGMTTGGMTTGGAVTTVQAVPIPTP